MPERSNGEWIAELRGERGKSKRHTAFVDLSKYLYKVLYNYLISRQGNLAILANFAPEEVAALAQDFVQDTLERLLSNEFALLDQFKEGGRFTSWAAQIAIREAGQELRKSYWTRRDRLPASADAREEEHIATTPAHPASHPPTPDQIVIRQQLLEQLNRVLQGCLDNLAASRRLAFFHFLIEGRAIDEVADTLNLTVNAVYLLIHRSKRDLRKCLGSANIGPDILEIFEE